MLNRFGHVFVHNMFFGPHYSFHSDSCLITALKDRDFFQICNLVSSIVDCNEINLM